MTIRIGINGLGRIGRCVARAIVEEGYDDIRLVAANGSASNANHAHLLQYDSVHGRFHNTITFDDAGLDMGRGEITITHERDPSKIDWQALGVDVVLECTGAFNSKEAASVHLKSGAKKVLISAPAGEDCPTFVYGVNSELLTEAHNVFSIGSCTTNALAPIAKILDERFGIESAFMTTIHAFTGDQNLVDGSHKDLQRARAATLSMVPTKTGAAKAIGLVLPQLAGKMNGVAIRVPTPNVSLVDLTVVTQKPVTKDAVNAAFTEAAATMLPNVLKVNAAPLVSVDFSHDNGSSIVDLAGTHVVNGTLLRVAAWYDNEWGFSCRMLDMARLAAG
ncbi:MAG: type I glyceraldehyde-3-phosphate dehydrogenase [Alphaproteobacteria bacterium]|nr:type I glyceraldehyde-3-phosphate dehydrogenase [Alphaproteobacteria bacterium]